MGKANGQNIHIQTLKPSIPDTVALGDAVEVRFLELCALHFREKHEDLVPPPYLNSDMLLWRTMRVRHKGGDFRNSSDELKSTQRVADWTLKVKCELTGQEYVPLEWG